MPPAAARPATSRAYTLRRCCSTPPGPESPRSIARPRSAPIPGSRPTTTSSPSTLQTIAARTRPGQFVMVKPGRGLDPLLRRPFSVFQVLRDARRHADRRLDPRQDRRQGHRPPLRPSSPASGSPASVRSAVRSRRHPTHRPVWFVAGGVGLAPFATLAESCLCTRPPADALLRCAPRRATCTTPTGSPASASTSALPPKTAAPARTARDRRRSARRWPRGRCRRPGRRSTPADRRR